MKLDRIKFAKVVAFVSNGFGVDDVQALDDMIEMPDQTVHYTAIEKVDDLLKHINREGGLVEAIKAYRALTGAGLKESKDVIDKYRNVKPIGQD